MPQKILIVDDDLDTLKLVGTTLERKGFEILAAKDGQQGLEFAKKESPDLILLDIMMPKMDGYEVTRRLREDPATADIPIIMFTAKAQVDDKVEGLEAGADDYLTKPTHPSELVARVRAMLKRPRGSTQSAPVEAATSVSKRIIGLIAPKGGLGLSTLAINLGVSLHEKTKEGVVVAEMQPGRGTIGLYLGLNASQAFSDLLQREPKEITRQEIEKALVSHSSGAQLLLASTKASDARLQDASEQLEAVVEQVAYFTPYTILDLGASLSTATQKLLARCDELVVVLESRPQTVQQAKTLLNELLDLGIQRQKLHPVVLNRERMEQAMSASSVQQELGYELSTVFTPAPELAYQAASLQKAMVSIDPNSLTKQQMDKLVDNLTR